MTNVGLNVVNQVAGAEIGKPVFGERASPVARCVFVLLHAHVQKSMAIVVVQRPCASTAISKSSPTALRIAATFRTKPTSPPLV